MQKKFYFKKRFENEIEGPSFLSEIKALQDNANIQITDFKSAWSWISDLENIKKTKKNDNDFHQRTLEKNR